MAGRGTDIKLGPGVTELGGLVVVGTERMMNQRIDLKFVVVLVAKEILDGPNSLFLWKMTWWKTGEPDWIQDTYQDYDVEERIGATKPLTKRKI